MIGLCGLSNPLPQTKRPCYFQLTHMFNERYLHQGKVPKVNTITCSAQVTVMQISAQTFINTLYITNADPQLPDFKAISKLFQE